MKGALLLTAGIILGAIIVTGAYYLGQKYKSLDKTPEVVQPTATSTVTPTPTQGVKQTGTIEGSLGYPSEGIPEDMTVCTENNQTLEKYCTGEHLKNSKYTYGLGYKLEVPAGSYLVYAQVPNFGDGYRAYYSEFVTCGLNVNCLSHKPIEVTVSAGETVDSVDPQDWYNQ